MAQIPFAVVYIRRDVVKYQAVTGPIPCAKLTKEGKILDSTIGKKQVAALLAYHLPREIRATMSTSSFMARSSAGPARNP
jgi:hypothetical protein